MRAGPGLVVPAGSCSRPWRGVSVGVPAKTVRALARNWGRKKTYIGAGGWGNGHGGACRVRSAPGQGSTFTIRLPTAG